MKTDRQSVQSIVTNDSNDLVELDESALGQVGGGAGSSKLPTNKPFEITDWSF
jgi:hypothetical protein